LDTRQDVTGTRVAASSREGSFEEPISYDGVDYAVDRLRAVPGQPYGAALEVGCGNGSFLLNLMRGGVIERGAVTDSTPAMVEVVLRHARSLGLEVDGRVGDANRIPYDGASFDLVVADGVLGHIPDVRSVTREVLRVLKPGGRFVFAGVRTRIGDFYGRRLGQLTWWLTTNVTRVPTLASWRPDAPSRAALDAALDKAGKRAFDPAELERIALGAGAVDVRAVPEELSAELFGCPVRAFESAVPDDRLGTGWATFANRTWHRLSWMDRTLLSKVLPRDLFHHVLVTGQKPDDPQRL
jgi:ubiquinone/menaquinone biosynthesis C-methylase UbiE